MDATKTTRWIGIGLLGLPFYGALTFWSSMNPKPDPNTHYEAWSRFATTDHYVWTYVMGSIVGLILAIFGTFALGAFLANSRAGRLVPLDQRRCVVGRPRHRGIRPRGRAGDERRFLKIAATTAPDAKCMGEYVGV